MTQAIQYLKAKITVSPRTVYASAKGNGAIGAMMMKTAICVDRRETKDRILTNAVTSLAGSSAIKQLASSAIEVMAENQAA